MPSPPAFCRPPGAIDKDVFPQPITLTTFAQQVELTRVKIRKPACHSVSLFVDQVSLKGYTFLGLFAIPNFNAMNINVTVTDPEVIAAMKAWQNGVAYNLAVTQDAPMQFTVNAAEEAPVVEEEAPEALYDGPDDKMLTRKDMASKSPGIAMMMAKGK